MIIDTASPEVRRASHPAEQDSNSALFRVKLVKVVNFGPSR
ncbi:hypothetical protein [Sphingomonas lenta]|nr:hypothetical protein [Sphingomonas lenta]